VMVQVLAALPLTILIPILKMFMPAMVKF